MILIYTERDSPRLRYTLDFVFTEFFGMNYSLIQTLPERTDLPLLNYTEIKIQESINIIPAGLLFNEIPNTQQLNPVWKNSIPLLFANENCDTDHDIFSSVFYCLSRYEEYDSYVPDEHGRFPATSSLAYRQGFLEIPVVDIWLIQLKNLLKKKYLNLEFKERKFSFHSTIDVDNAFKYAGKNFLRQIAGAGRDLIRGKINHLAERLNFLLGKSNDPFDAYDFQLETAKKYNTELTYFILYTYPGKNDHSLFPENKFFLALIEKLNQNANLGIHPGYTTSIRWDRLQEDINKLSKVCRKNITISRQHFLRFRLPVTYHQLENLGIKKEYSMGYSTHNGFRAGTATPFLFYDLIEEKTTGIKIFPFQVMDSVFYDHQKKDTTEAIQEIENIIKSVKEVDGKLYTVWHDRSFDEKEFPGWKSVYLHLHQLCST